ncbi:YuiA family protein [Neobacillus fumarioli]|nr:YuiA family protein [Neobacillus fumarioli]
MTIQSVKAKSCDYCSGTGYFQLLLGGSETCPNCEGSGKKKES